MKIKMSEQEGLTVDTGQALCSVRQTYNQREEVEKKDTLRGSVSSRTGERGLLPFTLPPPPTASRCPCHPVLGPLGKGCSADPGRPQSCTESAADPGWHCSNFFVYFS